MIRAPGGPEVLKIEEVPVPVPRVGEALIRVKAFGVNRSELFTRQEHSSYSGDVEDFMRMPFDALVQQVAEGALRVQIGRTFRLDEIAEAHRCMEENRAGGKIVVLT
ncbi:oxidoreductase [Chondromyces apiculatus DSM 436]|uniref:Oxidoreductase n=1 Tax=Chondromyces apiculatus DSM 436 TaxID=1192034 RepID=A0A017TEC4_9BACT|nr:oxidoreductase [Chondromyces apiculatus DSM 436]